MFHTIITLAYIVPNIYVFLRIWHLFINKSYRIHYTIIYILLVLVYPASNLLSEESTNIVVSALRTIANYILPFYLYLFLSVLLFDLLLLINLIFRIVRPDILKMPRFRIVSLVIIIALSISVVIAGIINFNLIRTSEYKIEIPAKLSKITHLKIAFVADFHLQEGLNVHFVERFAKKIADINPDLMVFGGDIVEGDREDENMAVFEKLLCGIKPKYGVFAVLGNHEYYGGQDKGSFFDKSCMKVLCDTTVIIDGSISLGGRYDMHFKERKSIDSFMKSSPDSLPLILIDHRPTEIEQVSRTAVDIQLSGHTHDGQMFPINLITRRVYELSRGYRKIRNTHFFVTSGIRLWGPPVRTVGKSEIMVVDVTLKSAK